MKKLFTTSFVAAALVMALSASLALAADTNPKVPAKSGATAAATMPMANSMCESMMKSGGMMGAMGAGKMGPAAMGAGTAMPMHQAMAGQGHAAMAQAAK